MSRSMKLIAVVLTLVAIGGVAATGAFATVDAERTATVKTAGDGTALLQLESLNSNIVTKNNGQIKLKLNDLNVDAETNLGEVIKVKNNGQDKINLAVSVSNDGNDASSSITVTQADSSSDLTDGNTISISSGSSKNIEIEIDTTDDVNDVGKDTTILTQITFEATNANN